MPVDKIKDRWKTIYLMCGHNTLPETDEFYSHWKPARGKHFCEECGEWVDKQPESPSDVLPDEPPF